MRRTNAERGNPTPRMSHGDCIENGAMYRSTFVGEGILVRLLVVGMHGAELGVARIWNLRVDGGGEYLQVYLTDQGSGPGKWKPYVMSIRSTPIPAVLLTIVLMPVP